MKALCIVSCLLCLTALTLASSTPAPLKNADETPPSITSQPAETIVDSRNDLILQCEATGDPSPTYYWEKDGAIFDVDTDTRASLDGGNLIISKFVTTDNGQYQCFANNKLGKAMSNKVNATLAYLDQFEDTQTSTVNVNLGESKVMRCGTQNGPPDSMPSPSIYWTDASPKPAPIVYNERVNQDPNGNLVFSNVITSDAKGYYCTVLNYVIGESKRSPKITLAVNDVAAVPIAAELVAKPDASVVALRTTEQKLKCIATGYPTPSITWTKDGQPLSGERIEIEPLGGQELKITNVQFEDRGDYKCVASNDEGSDEATSTVTVESAPYFPDPPSDVTKGPSESVTIECQASGVPAPTVEWLFNGQPWADFQASYDTQNRWAVVTGQADRASITISDLVTHDSNVFQCLATNKYKEVLTSVVLNVVAIEARILTFTPESKRLTVLEEDSATFICDFEGRPSPTVTWTFKGEQLNSDNKYLLDDATGTLTINNVVDADSGDYTCTVRNNIDGNDYEDDGSANLDVLAKTVIATPPADQTVTEGDPAIFQCEIISDVNLSTPPVVYWMMGDTRLDAASDHSYTIASTGVADSGTYMCVVETILDEATQNKQIVNASATLVVRGRPSPPVINSVSPQEALLRYKISWTPGSANNADIEEFVIQFITDWDTNWQAIETVPADGTQNQYETIALDPYVTYTLRIIAYNEIGPSDPSEEKGLAGGRTPPAPPTLNPSDVTGSSTDPTSLVIRWTSIDPYNYAGENFKYLVTYSAEGINETQTEVSASESALIVEATTPYQEFTFKVQSKNDEGVCTKSVETHTGYSGEAKPGAAPSDVTVTVLSSNAVEVTWVDIPADQVNGVLQGYNVKYNLQIGSGQDFELCTTSPCEVGNLQAFSTYEISVAAVTGAGEGPASTAITITTEAAPPGPVSLKVEAFSYRLIIEWKAPIEVNGELSGYKLSIAEMTEESVGEWMNFTYTPEDATSQRISDNVKPNTNYRVEMVAINNKGEGAKVTQEPTTLSPGSPAKPPVPEYATGLNDANFTWMAKELNPSAEKVYIEYWPSEDKSSKEKTAEFDVLDQEGVMVSELEASTEYGAQLVVTNTHGTTTSDPITFKTASTDEVVDPGFRMGAWLIILICIIIVLIIILLIICIIKSQKGGKYNVSDKEKALKNDIESTPLNRDEGGFDEYKPPSDAEPLRRSQESLDNSEHGSSETDSLKEYADGETGKFDEEGSFIGQYGDNKKQRPVDEEQGGGAAYSTFV